MCRVKDSRHCAVFAYCPCLYDALACSTHSPHRPVSVCGLNKYSLENVCLYFSVSVFLSKGLFSPCPMYQV